MSDASTVALKEIMRPIKRGEFVEPEKNYKVLAVHWYAKGLYVKYSKPGSEIRARRMYRVEVGDFVYNRLFAWKGSFAIVKSEHSGCYVSGEFPCFRVEQSLADPRYLHAFFSWPWVWNTALGLSMGGTQISRNRLKEERFLNIRIRLPSLLEQRRVVKRIERLSTKTDEIRNLRRQSTIGTEMLLDAYSQEIFEGLKLRPFLVRLRDADLTINRETKDPSGTKSNSEFAYVDISSVGPGPATLDKAKLVPANLAPSRARRVIRTNDVIFSTVRPQLKAVAKIGERLNNQICSTGFAVFSCGPSLDPDFLLYQLCSPFFIRQCVGLTTGAHYPAINESNLRNVSIVAPPLAQQHQIVSQLAHLKAKADALRGLQMEALAKIEAFMPSALYEAFHEHSASALMPEKPVAPRMA